MRRLSLVPSILVRGYVFEHRLCRRNLKSSREFKQRGDSRPWLLQKTKPVVYCNKPCRMQLNCQRLSRDNLIQTRPRGVGSGSSFIPQNRTWAMFGRILSMLIGLAGRRGGEEAGATSSFEPTAKGAATMSVMFEVYYKLPADPKKESALSVSVSRFGGRLTYRE